MPEVADGAGLLFDPHSIDDIKRSMTDILLDAELRSRMERLGLQRAAQFSWQRSARETLSAYEEVAAESGVRDRAVLPPAMAEVQRKK
jgi:glycosyltransferase involved in cell wall biosynthesis